MLNPYLTYLGYNDMVKKPSHATVPLKSKGSFKYVNKNIDNL
jgi:hypothetical protein